MNVFGFVSPAKRTNNANNATHYVKIGEKRRKSSKRNYYFISPRVMIKAIIIIYIFASLSSTHINFFDRHLFSSQYTPLPQHRYVTFAESPSRLALLALFDDDDDDLSALGPT